MARILLAEDEDTLRAMLVRAFSDEHQSSPRQPTAPKRST